VTTVGFYGGCTVTWCMIFYMFDILKLKDKKPRK
jgi:hypothetical protein